MNIILDEIKFNPKHKKKKLLELKYADYYIKKIASIKPKEIGKHIEKINIIEK